MVLGRPECVAAELALEAATAREPSWFGCVSPDAEVIAAPTADASCEAACVAVCKAAPAGSAGGFSSRTAVSSRADANCAPSRFAASLRAGDGLALSRSVEPIFWEGLPGRATDAATGPAVAGLFVARLADAFATGPAGAPDCCATFGTADAGFCKASCGSLRCSSAGTNSRTTTAQATAANPATALQAHRNFQLAPLPLVGGTRSAIASAGLAGSPDNQLSRMSLQKRVHPILQPLFRLAPLPLVRCHRRAAEFH